MFLLSMAVVQQFFLQQKGVRAASKKLFLCIEKYCKLDCCYASCAERSERRPTC